eukprot:TRINITY_DN42029_c0_g1_i1.p1 TRINITY_DN42029_c0_g1~~TRINITY_DN42029_c0_g1_i1.p1  ORF type:complete len:568 (+),score=98.90 TRINITY_DN42029_c0_g1_i1:119-1822(+)
MGQRQSAMAPDREDFDTARLGYCVPRHSRNDTVAGEYNGLDSAELTRLVASRGIPIASRQLDSGMLELLLRAYDIGAKGDTSFPCTTQIAEAMGRPQLNSAQVPLSVVCQASVLKVLQLLRDAPGHMGVDIGGTLVKLVLAMPRPIARSICLPESFGHTGKTHRQLDMEMTVRGETWLLTCVSGSTSLMERAVKTLGDNRHHQNLPGRSTSMVERPRSRSSIVKGGTGQGAEGHGPSLDVPRALSGWSDIGSSSYRPVRRIATAGGGACKLAPLFREALRLEINPVKELAAVVDGFLLLAAQEVVNVGVDEKCDTAMAELFTVDEDGSTLPLPWPHPLFPLLIVNMGSGVSILRVNSADSADFERVGGTACGGATFLGLARALTAAKTFEAALALAEDGDASRADKLVGDIYGEEGSKSFGLASGITAANFGKLCDPGCLARCTEADLARSLLQMVTQQSVLQATALAKHAECVGRVFFVGGFVDAANHLARETIAANFRSLGCCAYFLRHCDFLGALGSLAFALRCEDARDDDWSVTSQSPVGSSPSRSLSVGTYGLCPEEAASSS